MTTADVVRGYLLESGDLTRVGGELTDDIPLIEMEVLDSVGLLAFVEHLETTFAIEIDDSGLVRENFENIGCIVRYVDRLRSELA